MGGGRCRGLPSHFTAAELRLWRVRRQLSVAEMALLVGLSRQQLERRLYGKAEIKLLLDRAIDGVDAQVARGVVPPGAPDWLARRILAGLGW